MIQFQNLRFRSIRSCSCVYSNAMVDTGIRQQRNFVTGSDLEGLAAEVCTASLPRFGGDAAASQKRVSLRTT
jgi:hypothetical protein